MSDLTGKVIVVTGAARGIGAAIAKGALAQGAEVIPTDRDPCGGIVADLSEPDAPERILSEAIAQAGRVDGLVNAAGLTTRASFEDADVARFDTLVAVNLRAPFFLMSGLIRHLKARGAGGAIVNIQSMNAHCGVPDLAIYAGTKGGLQTLTKNAAQHHVADRIRVNGINLGWVATETETALHAAEKGPGWLDAQAAAQPLGRFVTAEECAAQAVWLLSEASAPMTGVSLDLEQWVAGAPPC
ncbi:SDR family oxidoreductase [Rhodobacterales bacterium HKCCE4037]|nr:SDR family oxidoreductase [Rhodobacterales bacterium HKCCE4037]